MLRRSIAALAILSAFTAACVSAPRGPALSLSEAGLKTTTAFSEQLDRSATSLRELGVLNVYTQRWRHCQNAPRFCEADDIGISEEVEKQRVLRDQLSTAINARSRALLALRDAYAMMGTEARYDAPADLTGATKDLIEGVNGFIGAINTVTANPLVGAIGQPLAAIAQAAAGEIAEQRQRDRLISASRKISLALVALRAGLGREASVHNRLAELTINERASFRAALLEAGLISATDELRPLAARIGAALVPNANDIIARSEGVRRAMRDASIEAVEEEALVARQRYTASLAALDALLVAHRQLEMDQGVSLNDLNRILDRLTSALDEGEDEAVGGAQP